MELGRLALKCKCITLKLLVKNRLSLCFMVTKDVVTKTISLVEIPLFTINEVVVP